ncbi:MAG TPA: hypothetical protein VN176_14435 [Verrucomicrobiae bacterium]|nr:hypothetical protein [Verrucomicrobiae bacterium]
MKLRKLSLLIAVAIALTGCNPAVSLRPLPAADEKPVAEPKVEGEWVSGTKDEVELRWKVRYKDGHYLTELRKRPDKDGEEPDDVDNFKVTLVRWEDKLFFDAELLESQSGGRTIRPDDIGLGMTPVHMVGRVWLHPDYLRIAMLNSEWLKNHSPEEFRAMVGSTAVITASTGDLRQLLLQHAEDHDVLPYAWYLCRPGADCAILAAEDELAHEPNEPDTLRDVARVFNMRGDYKRALALLRHRAELQPENESSREDLAVALLFTGDFAAARAEFAAAAKLGTNDQLEQVNIGWTYFMEGNYKQGEKAFAGQLAGRKPWVESILLDYFSLIRLGRVKEAQALLSKQTAQFAGKTDDHKLLLEAQGRLDEVSPWQSEEPQTEARFEYFFALKLIAEGKPDFGKIHLESALKTAAKDTVLALAVKIELERLPAN